LRFVFSVLAAIVVFLSSAAYAQSWDVYTNRESFFSVNFPAEPTVAQAPYKTLKGKDLTARVFTATVPPGSRLSGTYKVTVVDFSNAKDEANTATEQAADTFRKRGTVKYDAIENLDLHATRRLTVETPTTRVLAEILFAANNHLYISQAETALNLPPPAQFQASLQVLDDQGVRIRERTLLGLPEGSKQPLNAGGIADEPETVAALLRGSWRVAGGTCDKPYFKSGMAHQEQPRRRSDDGHGDQRQHHHQWHADRKCGACRPVRRSHVVSSLDAVRSARRQARHFFDRRRRHRLARRDARHLSGQPRISRFARALCLLWLPPGRCLKPLFFRRKNKRVRNLTEGPTKA
jgi:hypothetical protein